MPAPAYLMVAGLAEGVAMTREELLAHVAGQLQRGNTRIILSMHKLPPGFPRGVLVSESATTQIRLYRASQILSWIERLEREEGE